MHLVAIVATLIWFLLVAALWYVRPSANLWFLGSLALGTAYFLGFWWYVTRPK
jgi:hypothetical protein